MLRSMELQRVGHDWVTELKPSSLSWRLGDSLWELAFCVIRLLFPPSTPRVAFATSQGRAGPVLASTVSLCRFIQEIFSHDTSICWKICVINKSKVCALWLAPPGRQDPRWVVGLLSTCEADVQLVLAWWWTRRGSGITRGLTGAYGNCSLLAVCLGGSQDWCRPRLGPSC